MINVSCCITVKLRLWKVLSCNPLFVDIRFASSIDIELYLMGFDFAVNNILYPLV